MPTNLYGEGDSFNLENSHVVPALIMKFHQAMLSNSSSIQVWGSGNAKREFLYVDDLASAAIHLLSLSKERFTGITQSQLSHINVGTGEEVTIAELSAIIAKIINFTGEIVFDDTQLEGPLRKVVDSSLIRSTQWSPSISLLNGLKKTYDCYKASIK
jgi:GDP-L-fucose synthase